MSLMKNIYTKMYLKCMDFIYYKDIYIFMYLNTLQLYFYYTKLVYSKSAKLAQLIL